MWSKGLVAIPALATNVVNTVIELMKSRPRKCLDNLEATFLEAVEQGNLNNITRCIRDGVNTKCHRYSDGFTALHIAVDRDDTDFIIMLLNSLKCHVNVNSTTIFGATALHIACARRNVTVVNSLLTINADPNIPYLFDKTSLHIAVEVDNVPLVELLLQHGALPNLVNDFGETPLHVAAINTLNISMVKLLIEYGANINVTRTNLPLFLECVLGCQTEIKMEIVLYLMECGQEVNVTDEVAKRNALHFVALTGYLPLATVLLNFGCKLEKIDHFGKIPLDIAIIHGNNDVASLLENYLDRHLT